MLLQIVRNAATVGPNLQKLAFMALVNLSANGTSTHSKFILQANRNNSDKVRVEIAKLGGVSDAISVATAPSPAQEDAIKLVTNLAINGNVALAVSLCTNTLI